MSANPLSSLLVLLFGFAGTLLASETGNQPLAQELADPAHQACWRGLEVANGGQLPVPGLATITFTPGPRGWYEHGFRKEFDGAADWSRTSGLHLELVLTGPEAVDLTVAVLPPLADAAEPGVVATVRIAGAGVHAVNLPWAVFTHPRARDFWLYQVGGVRLAVGSVAGVAAPVRISGLQVVAGDAVALSTPISGASVAAGGTVTYALEVGNPTSQRQLMRCQVERNGWEAMTTVIAPESLDLAAGERQMVTVRVTLPLRLPPGASEAQVIRVISGGDGSHALTATFTTACALAHPNLLHQAAGWRDIRERVARYPWAAAARDVYVAKAEAWVVPEVAKAPDNLAGDTMGPYLFATTHELDLMACAIAWQLTGERAFAEKTALFLRRLADPRDGYPLTLRGCNQGFVQEGHFFQHLAQAYDLILDAGVLDADDQALIAGTFRLFMGSVERSNRSGQINNWNVSELGGAFCCALALQDLAAAQRFFSAPCGIVDQLAKGTMDDGWWYECSISYNTWVASEFTQFALAYAPWGVNFSQAWVPASYARDVSLSDTRGRAELNGGSISRLDAADRPFGMSRELWGPLTKPYRKITDLWDSLLPFVDDRGVMIGINDSTERKVAGEAFELAYFAYRDPRYAALIPRDGKRDLLYGVPELPPLDPKLGTTSATSANVGLTMLRSQTAERPPRQQIEAAVHYGTHGWAHGHFDRTNLLALTRYGRSFYNPEMVWYSYAPFMYKFFVQTSMTKNMVVVDRKMQDPTESRQLLFHSGPALQATVVETVAKWSDPPYGGMVYDYLAEKDFAAKMWAEGRTVPMPRDPPAYGTRGRFSEPIRQRRLLAVTDDYVVLADALSGTQPHTFDCLFQMKGFQSLTAAAKRELRHDPQMDPDPRGAAQFITDCQWWQVTAPAHASFLTSWGPGADNAGTRAPESEDGPLALDVHLAWPQQAPLMLGLQPESFPVEKQVTWTVAGDGKILAEGKVGTWVLGTADVDVALQGVNQVELRTQIPARKLSTLFWAGARMVLADGREVPLSELAPGFANVQIPAQPGQDYQGGPITIAGTPWTSATPAEPQDVRTPAVIRIDLAGRGAVRLKATLGGDYPVGEQTARRRTLAIRSEGLTARFLTVIEPSEGKRQVRSISADGADHLVVELVDGRRQELTIHGLEGDGEHPTVELSERRNGVVVRSETAESPAR